LKKYWYCLLVKAWRKESLEKIKLNPVAKEWV